MKKKRGFFQSIFRKKEKEGLAGKYVLITGATRGVGLEAAKQFAEAGCHLVLIDNNYAELEKIKERLKRRTLVPVYPKSKVEIQTYAINATDKMAVQYLASSLSERIERIDILVNNVGASDQRISKSNKSEQWQQLLEEHLWVPLYYMYAFLPLLKEQKSGHIINVSSGQTYFDLPTIGLHTALKTAVSTVSELLYYELKRYDVRVTTLSPYFVHTGERLEQEEQSLAIKLAHQLRPLYMQKPKKVALKILEAAETTKQIEVSNALFIIAKGINLVNPMPDFFSKGLGMAIAKNEEWQESDTNWQTEIIEPLLMKLYGLKNMLEGMAYASIGELGFRVDEVMKGEQHWVRGERKTQAIELKLNWGADSLLTWSNPFKEDFMTNYLEGTVTIEGLCEEAPCYGQLELRYFTEQKIRYKFEFEANEESYVFEGEKREIYPWNLPSAHASCFGELRKVGDSTLLATSTLQFNWKTLPAMLRSFEWLK